MPMFLILLIENNRIWQAYDAGITSQSASEVCSQHDIHIQNNVIWDCGQAFDCGITTAGSTISNYYVENNTFVDSGGGWSETQRAYPEESGRGPGMAANLSFWGNAATITNFYVLNNVLSGATGADLMAGVNWYTDLDQITLDYNLYYNSAGTSVIYWEGTYYTANFAAYQSVTGKDAHSIVGSPAFVDPANYDFHLLFQFTGDRRRHEYRGCHRLRRHPPAPGFRLRHRRLRIHTPADGPKRGRQRRQRPTVDGRQSHVTFSQIVTTGRRRVRGRSDHSRRHRWRAGRARRVVLDRQQPNGCQADVQWRSDPVRFAGGRQVPVDDLRRRSPQYGHGDGLGRRRRWAAGRQLSLRRKGERRLLPPLRRQQRRSRRGQSGLRPVPHGDEHDLGQPGLSCRISISTAMATWTISTSPNSALRWERLCRSFRRPFP